MRTEPKGLAAWCSGEKNRWACPANECEVLMALVCVASGRAVERVVYVCWFVSVAQSACVAALMCACCWRCWYGCQNVSKCKDGAAPGIEPGTSCTRSKNHTTRPRGHNQYARLRTIHNPLPILSPFHVHNAHRLPANTPPSAAARPLPSLYLYRSTTPTHASSPTSPTQQATADTTHTTHDCAPQHSHDESSRSPRNQA